MRFTNKEVGADGELTKTVDFKFIYMNSQQKKYIILVFSCLVIILATVCFFMPKRINQIDFNKNNITLPIPSESDAKMKINTKKGLVIINNVYKNTVEHLSNNGVAFADNDDYYMAYYPADQGFLIVIQNKDIQSARQKAEADFLSILGIFRDDACKLKVSLAVPFYVNEFAAGGNYHLSFCSDGKPFPE